jgi:HlyD family secretion protein
MNIRTWLIVGAVVVAVVVIAVGAGSLWSRTSVEAGEARRGPIDEFVDERGKTRLPETYLITMPCTGRIESITLTEGDPVRKDDAVAQIVPADLKLAFSQADAMVKRLDASIEENSSNAMETIALKQVYHFVQSMNDTVAAAAKQVQSSEEKHKYAQKHLKRIQDLRPTEASTQEDLERAELQEVEDRLARDQNVLIYQSMKALQAATDLTPELVKQFIQDKGLTKAVLEWQKAEAAARRDQAELDQQRGTIDSPVDGVVLKRHVSNERFLTAGTPLLEIGRLEDLEIEAEILSLDVVDVQVGDPVRIYGPAIGRRLADGKDHADGTVQRIYPAGFTKISSLGVEQQRVIVIIHIDPEDLRRLREERGLGVGYRVRVRITTAENPGALVVPRSALFRGTDGTWRVYAVVKGRARIQPVEIGMLNDEWAEVVEGLAEGDLVVRAPESNLADGQRVEAVLESGQ